jgi:ribosomal protein S18 acetylase RimI-like enzyme
MPPLNPFYLGLYGGSESAGFLDSDAAAEPFLARHGYARWDSALVLHRLLDGPVEVVDARFVSARRRFDLVAGPRRGSGSWWRESVLGPIDLLDVRLVEKGGGRAAAQTAAWDMAGFSQRWQVPAVGIIDLEVREDLRRQGLARFVLASLLRHIQEQFPGPVLIEVQARERNEAAGGLYRGLGFRQADVGRIYRKG